MPPALSIIYPQFRHDKWADGTPASMQFNVTGLGSGRNFIQVGDFHYEFMTAATGGRRVTFANRSQKACPLTLFDMIDSTWTGSGMTISTSGGIRKVVNDINSLAGASSSATLSSTFTRLHGKPIAEQDPNLFPSLYGGISFQNTGATLRHDYTHADVKHGIRCDSTFQGIIYEAGVIKRYFRWHTGDRVILELNTGIVRYYLVKPDGRMILLRATASKLTTVPIAQISGLGNGGSDQGGMDDVGLYNAKATANFESIGVLEGFQDWFNELSRSSSAEAIEMADSNPQFTYPNRKKRLRTLSANLNMRTTADRLDYIDFFNNHGMETEFIFVDKARVDRDGNNEWFWARFGSPFGDKMRASCLSAHSAVIVESYRDDYIPPVPDES